MSESGKPPAEAGGAVTETITKRYKDHTITIGAYTDMRFRVAGPLIEHLFDSYQDAAAKIDDAIAKHEVQTRKRLALTVVDENGKKQTVTGVHAGNGSVLGLEKGRRFLQTNFYPNIPWITDTIQQIRELRKQYAALDEKLRPFMMRGSGGDLRLGDTHAKKVDALVALIEEKTKAAEAAAE